MNSDELEKYLKIDREIVEGRVADTFSKNLDDILNEQIPSTNLVQLARTKEIAERVKDEDREAIETYQNFIQTEELINRYLATGKAKDEKELKFILGAAARPYAKAARQRAQDQGYSETVQNMIEEVAASTAASGRIKEETIRMYAAEGLKENLNEARKDYQKVKGKVAGIVRGIIRDLGKSDSSEDFNLALGLADLAYKGKFENGYKAAA
jgi:vesicle coat complex subunit